MPARTDLRLLRHHGAPAESPVREMTVSGGSRAIDTDPVSGRPRRLPSPCPGRRPQDAQASRAAGKVPPDRPALHSRMREGISMMLPIRVRARVGTITATHDAERSLEEEVNGCPSDVW